MNIASLILLGIMYLFLLLLFLMLKLYSRFLKLITKQFILILFAITGIVTLVSLFIDSIFVQIAIFLVLTVLLLIVTKPMVKKIMNFKKISTNSDKNIGRKAFVTTEINNQKETGEVKIDSMFWSARSVDDTVIPENSEVIIENIKGVKLIVKKV